MAKIISLKIIPSVLNQEFFIMASIGIGYDRNIILKNGSFLSIHGSAGAGPDFDQAGYNQYYSLAPTFNFGKKYIYFSVGPQIKYVRQRRSVLKGEFIWTIPDNVVYEGLGIGGLMGLNFFSNIGITGKIQMGLTYLPEFEGVNKVSLGTGISIGYNFGSTK